MLDVNDYKTAGLDARQIPDVIYTNASEVVEFKRDLVEMLGRFSNRQLVQCICAYNGMTYSRENVIRKMLVKRLEPGDVLLMSHFDLVRDTRSPFCKRNDRIPVTVAEVNLKTCRFKSLEDGHWYGKNNINWKGMMYDKR